MVVVPIYLSLESHKGHLYRIGKAFINLFFQLCRKLKPTIKSLSETVRKHEKDTKEFRKNSHLHQDQ